MVTTTTSGVGWATSMLPPPVCAKHCWVGVALPCLGPRSMTTAGPVGAAPLFLPSPFAVPFLLPSAVKGGPGLGPSGSVALAVPSTRIAARKGGMEHLLLDIVNKPGLDAFRFRTARSHHTQPG